ncbi:MAG: response regulator [Anaerolineae bacterium]|nr:response regulator [Anaerolineae bacterium]MDQ7034262.1 response regulator [Anaerolineae bacterium]
MKNQGHHSRQERHVVRQNVKNWHILIVDDKFDNLDLAKTALEFHGATVRTATNGLEGLEALKTFEANLILLDLAMPVMTGWEMFEAMQEKPELAAIPVIALTAHAMAGDKERVLEAGFTGYISKPFSVSTLADEIQAILDNDDTQESAEI